MKKFILLFCFFFSSLSNAQESIKLWLVDDGYCFYLGQSTVSHINLPTAKLAIIRGDTDTLWFSYGDKKTVRMQFAFNPADLPTKSTLKPRFSVGDSVTAFIWNQWYNAKVIGISDKRYLITHEKFLYNPVTRIWVDFEKVEDYVYSKKYLSK